MNQPSCSENSTDLTAYLEAACAACDGAREILNRHFGNLRKIDEKFQAGLVSEADRESENYIVSLLKKRFPDHSILGEEFGLSSGQKAGAPLWMIDPLDGTTNYIHQFPFFCISVGLEINGELVVGVVDAPKLGMRFHAVKGGGAFMNGESIHASRRQVFRDGLFATGYSARDESLGEQLDLTAMIIRDTRGVRRAGAAALDLCFVAKGVFDAFWERHLAPWDTAAGVVIAREAGAVVTTLEGEPFNPRLPSVLACNPAMHEELVARAKLAHNRLRP